MYNRAITLFNQNWRFILAFFLSNFAVAFCFAQTTFTYKGLVTDQNNKPVENATISSYSPNKSVLSNKDGIFILTSTFQLDSINISCVGFVATSLQNPSVSSINHIVLNYSSNVMQTVTVGGKGRVDNYLIRKVIDRKSYNNPARYNAFSYRRYTRNQLLLTNIDFTKSPGNGLKGLLVKTYTNFDTTAKYDNELPIYFNEKLFKTYHSISPKIEDELLIAEKNFGLKTDEMVKDLDKFYLCFNIYDDWIPVFDQSFISPLNPNALNYYKFLVQDTIIEKSDTAIQLKFLPLRNYEKAFRGNLWINPSKFAVLNVNMRLNKSANLNFVSDINYDEEYKFVYDAFKDDMVYMPYKYSSEVLFESGLSILGIPQKSAKKRVQFVIKNTTVNYDINLADKYRKKTAQEKKQEAAMIVNGQSDEFWIKNRPDSLTNQEKNIYFMIDSLKKNQKFQTDIKMISLVGSGYWDIKNKIRVGPLTSLISMNQIEGYRCRTGFWTLPGISKKFNANAYLAYGTKDALWKGKAGVKYIWNAVRWTKTSLSYSSDYDLLNINADELDNDNILTSVSRKNLPVKRLFIKNAEIKHEQFINSNWAANFAINYKEINPSFDFTYIPLQASPVIGNDSSKFSSLPVGEWNIGLRYAHQETTTIFNYENLKLSTYFPIITINYIHGFAMNKNMFSYNKAIVSLQQWMRLPPKFLLYYKFETGWIQKTLPYLLLDIPAGNQFFVSSKYVFNTMNPYEFVADKYISLQTRLNMGGAIFDNIPIIQKLGWRERLSFNGYWGDMSNANQLYNKSNTFYIANKNPFMEASIGIENIFHFFSIEYFKRLSYLNHPSISKSGLFFGMTLLF